MAKNIKLIIGSTRQGRKSELVAQWLVKQASETGTTIEVLDLKKIALPLFDEPVSPMYKPIESPEAKKWAEQIASADGIVFLTSEYNRSIPASLKNAIDYLFAEWNGKKAGIVSYGYIDGGGSAAKHLKDIIEFVKMDVVSPEVAIHFNQDTFNEEGQFNDIDTALAEAKTSFLEVVKAL